MSDEPKDIERERAIARRDVSVLADRQLFVIQTQEGGRIRAYKAAVELRRDQGHLVNVGDRTVISAEGFDRLNQAAGLLVKVPPTVNVDGEVRRNPYRAVNRHGEVEEVTARVVVVGRAPNGAISAVDSVASVRPGDYFAQELASISRRQPDAARPCSETQFRAWKEAGRVRFTATTGWGKETREYQVESDAATWEFLPATSVGAIRLGVAINLAHPEVARKIAAQLDFVRFADRRVVTIARRNALRRHPCIAAYTVAPAPKNKDDSGIPSIKIPVYGWMPESDDEATTMAEQAEQIASDVHAPGVTVEVLAERETDPGTADVEDDVTPGERGEDSFPADVSDHEVAEDDIPDHQPPPPAPRAQKKPEPTVDTGDILAARRDAQECLEFLPPSQAQGIIDKVLGPGRTVEWALEHASLFQLRAISDASFQAANPGGDA